VNEEKYWEIDRFYSKAYSVFNEARDHDKKFEYDLCVRRARSGEKEVTLETLAR